MLGSSRGQSIPFWTFATISMLVMMLFVWNYQLNLTWQIRAQNAADSAAAAAHATLASVYNEETMLVYAAAVDEFRLRALNQAMINAIDQHGGCELVAGQCANDFNTLFTAFQGAEKAYQNDIALLGQANNFTQGGQSAVSSAVSALNGSCPGNTLLDCAFSYYFVGLSKSHGRGKNQKDTPIVEVAACRNVPWLGGSLLGLTLPTFQAVAIGTAAIAQRTPPESFSPGALNPSTLKPWQLTVENQWYQQPALPGDTTPGTLRAYEVWFNTPTSNNAALTLNLNWYTTIPYPMAVALTSNDISNINSGCKNG
jgi:hypothetical protein